MATTITTAAGLQDMDLDLTEDYILGGNIDCTDIANFEPVGGWNGADPFTGTFDGKGYTICNLTVDRAADDYIGLFGETDGATIKNVTLVDFVLIGDDYIGALVGTLYDTSIENITVINVDITGDDACGGMCGDAIGVVGQTIKRCTSTGAISAGGYVGGLIGDHYLYATSNCHSSVNVIGTSSFIGGLVGQWWTGTFEKCYATGTVTGYSYVGGFAGYMRGNVGTETADKCLGSGAVTATEDFAGGFVGYQGAGIVNDCYGTGAVTGDDYVGGFAGLSDVVNRCYSTGAITGVGANVGGFTGNNNDAMADCFWDKTTSGEAIGAGGGSPQTGLTGKTTAQMKDIDTILEAGWSIPQIWNVLSGCNGGYPCLVGVNLCCSASAAPPADPTIAPKKVSLELIRNIEMMNTGRAYIDKSGNFVYESRFHR